MKNVSGENLSCNDILYNWIEQFEFSSIVNGGPSASQIKWF